VNAPDDGVKYTPKRVQQFGTKVETHVFTLVKMCILWCQLMLTPQFLPVVLESNTFRKKCL
jgi:hypothetical protein